MENVRTTGSRLLGLVMAALIAIAMAAAVAALPAKAYADEDAVRDVANGVLKFNWHIDGEDYSRGSCFLINDQTVITAYHCTMFSADELKANNYSGTKMQDLRDRMTYSVTINRDVKVGATLVNYSEAQDFAILKLDQPLNGYKPLTFRDSSTVKAAETVYSVGFPANSDLKSIATYTPADATFKRGTVSKPEGNYGFDVFWSYLDGYFLQTDCPISGGDSGGPMVDADGNVVGISDLSTGEGATSYFCVASDAVMPVLKTLGIEYKEVGSGGSTTTNSGSTGSSSSAASPAAETYDLEFSKLDDAIKKATALNSDEYTAESFQAVTTALAAAKDAKKRELADNTDKDAYEEAQAQIDKAADDIDSAISGLEKKPEGLPTAAIIGIVVAIVALIAIIAAIMASRKKKGAQPAAPAAQAPVGAPAPAAPAAAQPALQSGAQTWQKPAAEGAAETTILEDEASDTVILFQAASGGSLTRMSTNEQIPINSAEFTIGRERSKVNYCLEGNSSISRIHVRIVVRDGKVYLVDNKAANGTFVNGVKCRPGEEVLLKSGDIITLADEKFKYSN